MHSSLITTLDSCNALTLFMFCHFIVEFLGSFELLTCCLAQFQTSFSCGTGCYVCADMVCCADCFLFQTLWVWSEAALLIQALLDGVLSFFWFCYNLCIFCCVMIFESYGYLFELCSFLMVMHNISSKVLVSSFCSTFILLEISTPVGTQ